MINIYFTSDMHSYGFPKPFEKDGDTLVIDGGDVLQGAPFARYCLERLGGFATIAGMMNDCGYDYVTLGNHDFNHGTAALASYLDNLNAKCLCQNVGYPYAIHTTASGKRIGIVGIVTDFVNVWEKPENLVGISITDPFVAAKNALAELAGQVDYTIGIYHGGFEKDMDTGKLLATTTENIACRLAEELDFDILLTGHQHMGLTGRDYHGTYVIQPPHHAKGYAHLTIADNGTIDSRMVTEPSAFVPIPDPVLAEQVRSWLQRPAGQLPAPLRMGERVDMAVNGSPIADFFNQVQLAYTGADVSVASLANDVADLPQHLSLGDLFAAYPYANTFVVVEMTGAQLRQAMERSAQYLSRDNNGELVVSDAFLKPKIEHYNYDFYAGVDYTLDFDQPVGQRVTHLSRGGQLVSDTHTLHVCVNNYRVTGAGGYPMYPECPVVREVNTEMTEMLLAYFAK